jgi:hypothetical protein
MKTPSEAEGTALGRGAAALAALVRSAVRPMTSSQRAAGLQAVTARLAARGRRRLGAVVAAAIATTAVATGAVLLVVEVRDRPQVAAEGAAAPHPAAPLGYRVEGGEVGTGGYVRPVGISGTTLRFSDGTELKLPAGARGRLGAVDDHGARLALEEGEASMHVVPRPDARWLLDAGPFLITVRGTTFTARWDGARERLDVRLQSGRVAVAGPLTEGQISVRAGQVLTVKVKEKEVVLREDGAAERAEPSQSPPALTAPLAESGGGSSHRKERAGGVRGQDRRGTVVAAAAPRSSSTAVEAGGPAARRAPAPPVEIPRSEAASPSRSRADKPAGGRAITRRSWAAALAAGDVDGVLADAENLGLAAALAEASSNDLAALADAARYRRRDDLAHRALLAQRERFPQTARAHDAAFLLGRLEDAAPGGAGAALRWYRQYLEEAPAGAYASEALGRKMIAVERLEGARAAGAVAEEYLRRFPGGTYAGAARAIRDRP